MNDNEWREAMARLDGYVPKQISGSFGIRTTWKKDRMRYESDDLPKYDTLKDMLRVCRKQRWTAQILQWNDGKVHATIVLNLETRCVAKADTPQAALRAAIEKVIMNNAKFGDLYEQQTAEIARLRDRVKVLEAEGGEMKRLLQQAERKMDFQSKNIKKLEAELDDSKLRQTLYEFEYRHVRRFSNRTGERRQK